MGTDLFHDGCPTRDALTAFGIGCLPDGAVGTIAEHIESCAACQALLDELDDHPDPLLGDLRRSLPPGIFLEWGSTAVPGLARKDAGGPRAAGLDEDTGSPNLQASEPWPVVPGYEVLEVLAHGGMGVVYRVFDPDLQRSLAVKVLPSRSRDYPDLEQRFRAEAQLTSQLQHPGIPPVHEVSVLSDGRPYFAMKLIQGRTLSALLAERQAPTEDLPRWLAIFLQVCQAVAYAHSRGVIHRDLKPTNIMVGAFGEVQVLDWGLAKVLHPVSEPSGASASRDRPDGTGTRVSSTGLSTQTGAVLGTAAYMAPEQARGEIDTLDERCDVFGLGGILCVILTGQPPYGGPTPPEQFFQARAAELTSAHARLDRSGADAELLQLARACMAREPSERPRDAGTVAAAVVAYQAGVADRLRRAELDQVAAEARAKEERKRRRLALVLAAIVLLLAVLMVVAPTVSLVLLRAEQQRTRNALDDEARRRQQARQALDMLTGPVIEEWLGKQPELSAEHKKYLEETLAVYTEFAAETSTDEASRAGLAKAHYRAGTIHSLLGSKAEAEAAYRQSVALYQQLAAELPDRIDYRKQQLRSLNHLAVVLAATGRSAAAEAVQRDLIQVQRELAAVADDPEIRAQLAVDLSNLGALAHRRGNLQEAATVLREAVTRFEDFAAQYPRRTDVSKGHATALMNLAGVLDRTGQPAEAERTYRDALRRLEQLAADPKYARQRGVRQDLGNAHTSLGNLLRQTKGRLRDAEAAHREALKVRQELSTEFPGHPSLRGDVADTFANLGMVLASLNRLGDAEEAYRNAIAIYEGAAGDLLKDPESLYRLARVQSRIGGVLDRRGRPVEAEQAHQAAHRLFQQLVAAGHGMPNHRYAYAVSLINLAQRHADRSEWAEARRLLLEAVPHHQAAVRANPLARDYQQCRCMNWYGLAQVLAEQKDHAALTTAATQLAEAAADAQLSELLEKAAAFLARSATLAEQDSLLSESRRAELASACTERAMTTLRLAVKHGYKDVARLKQEGFFASVRSRPDFEELLAELEKQERKP